VKTIKNLIARIRRNFSRLVADRDEHEETMFF
jgi:hypothetical protein